MLSADSKDSDWSPLGCRQKKLKTRKTSEGSHLYAKNNALFELEKKMQSKSMLTMMDTVQAGGKEKKIKIEHVPAFWVLYSKISSLARPYR